ncbi:MAG: c-type cytochrome [Fuerstiella sp.]|nr:c-type cytochrome [Fuerstiella sp.]MCP4858784.1 c-type cytochrome [Fuerstiella sp.]
MGVTLPNAIADSSEVGIKKRMPWTTSRISGSPEPPLPYVTEPAFPSLKFNQCLDITMAPGSDRLFVVEQSGKIVSFVNNSNVAQTDLVVDFAKDLPDAKQVYALTFHPDFQDNGYCYVCYVNKPSLDEGTHVARFQILDTDPPRIDVASETTLVTWLSGGHNGCCLKFGPDGFLYISTGDGGPANPPDIHRTGQDISDLLSSILRIDVDHKNGEKNYRIPTDNPFVGTDGARGEVWAYGLRNPWRMSFDRKTGDLWVGDVGWELWEMLYRIERGGNYGWAVMEGRASTHPEWARGPSPVLPPVVDHEHSESSSITEGATYYGARLKELYGTHIYSDYDTGKFWGFRYENGKVVNHRELADTTHRVVGFGELHDGELLLLDHTDGTIHRLVANPRLGESSTFPRTLSESGLFSSMTDLTPAPGVIAYSVNAEPWADHAVAERYVAVPNEASIKADGTAWTFPENTVLVKTLSLDMQQGDPTTRRRVETQILHFDGIELMPYTYQWNDDQSDATLVDASGAERTFEIQDSAALHGVRRQTWRFSGRAECQRCHNRWSGPALAFNTPQLDRVHNYGGTTASQLDTFAHIRLIEKQVDTENKPKLADPYDTSATLDDRARAYLHANCAHCHRLHAGGAVLSHMHFDLALDKTNMINTRPTQGTFGIHAAQVVAPGDPFRSVLLYRMAKLGSGRMPRVGSAEVDRAGVELLYNWLEQLKPEPDTETAADLSVAKLRHEELTALNQLSATETASEQIEILDGLLSSTTGAIRLLHSVDNGELSASVIASTVARAVRHSDVSVRDLFERFLPPEDRIKRLGGVVHSEQILSLSGDAVRGRQVFFNTSGVSCKNCHRIHKDGKEVGPDLTTIGKKLTTVQLLESILEPSKRIDPKYVTYLAETTSGRLFTGLLQDRDDKEVALKDAQDKVRRIPVADIEQLVPQRQSLMPDLLVRDMTAQQVADLLAYMSSLK